MRRGRTPTPGAADFCGVVSVLAWVRSAAYFTTGLHFLWGAVIAQLHRATSAGAHHDFQREPVQQQTQLDTIFLAGRNEYEVFAAVGLLGLRALTYSWSCWTSLLLHELLLAGQALFEAGIALRSIEVVLHDMMTMLRNQDDSPAIAAMNNDLPNSISFLNLYGAAALCCWLTDRFGFYSGALPPTADNADGDVGGAAGRSSSSRRSERSRRVEEHVGSTRHCSPATSATKNGETQRTRARNRRNSKETRTKVVPGGRDQSSEEVKDLHERDGVGDDELDHSEEDDGADAPNEGLSSPLSHLQRGGGGRRATTSTRSSSRRRRWEEIVFASLFCPFCMFALLPWCRDVATVFAESATSSAKQRCAACVFACLFLCLGCATLPQRGGNGFLEAVCLRYDSVGRTAGSGSSSRSGTTTLTGLHLAMAVAAIGFCVPLAVDAGARAETIPLSVLSPFARLYCYAGAGFSFLCLNVGVLRGDRTLLVAAAAAAPSEEEQEARER